MATNLKLVHSGGGPARPKPNLLSADLLSVSYIAGVAAQLELLAKVSKQPAIVFHLRALQAAAESAAIEIGEQLALHTANRKRIEQADV